MALVDFYQLAVLHNLSCGNVGVLPDRSYPPPMSPTTPSRSHSPVAESDQTGLPSLPFTQSVPKTPERRCNADQSIPDLTSTPFAQGTSVLQRLRLDTDGPQKYKSAKCEQYIIRDFERHLVFVDMDIFMKHVLHIPENWSELWGRTIRRIKRNQAFQIAHCDYTRQCGTQGVQEWKFYKPLVDMGSAILDFSKSSPDNSVKPKTSQSYLRNDPKKVFCGMMNDLSPDIVAIHDDFLPHIHEKECDERRLKDSNLSWAQPLQILEVKPWDSALVDGLCMPRLKVNGKHATASRNEFLWLKENRTRPTEQPCLPFHAITVPKEKCDLCNHRSTHR